MLFLLAGALLFVLDPGRRGGEDRYRIDVGESEVARLGALWQTQTGAEATDAELRNLIESWLREEIYYREAVRLSLDRDDTIVRRRLVQKLRFLTEAETTADPTEAGLRAWFEAHRADYRFPDRYSFDHVYVSPARHDDAAGEAARVLRQLEAGVNWRSLGDPFMLNSSYAERSRPEIRALFGGGFADALPTRVAGEWTGPIESAYGVHLVRLLALERSHPPPFEAVRERVREDYLEAHADDADEAYYQALRERYDVRWPGPS